MDETVSENLRNTLARFEAKARRLEKDIEGREEILRETQVYLNDVNRKIADIRNALEPKPDSKWVALPVD